jgi:signal transduction histidine kinase
MALCVRRIYTCFVALLALYSSAGVTHENISQRLDNAKPRISFCVDPILNIKEAVHCNYLPRSEIKFKQDFELIKWVKIEIHFHDSKQAAIFVNPHFLNKIELYENIDGQWTQQTAGSTLSSNDVHTIIGGYYFVSEVSASLDRTFYLKIDGSGLNNLDVTVTQWPSVDQASNTWLIGISMQLAGLTLIFLFAGISYLVTPTVVMGRFSILMCSLIFCTLSGSGILAKYLLPTTPYLDGPLFVIFLSTRIALWTWVAQAFLIGYQTPRWYKYACISIYVATLISIVDVVLSLPPIFQPLLLICFIAAPLIQLFGVLNTSDIEIKLKKVLAWGFLGASLLIVLALITNAYPYSDKPLPTYISRATDFINPIILLAIILYQYKQTRNELTRVQELLVTSNLEKEFERQLVAERRVLIDMLTHELKNPLASINMAVGTLKQSFNQENPSELRRIENITKSVKNMDLVIERVGLMNALDQKNIKSERSRFLLNDLLKTIISDFPINSPITVKVSQPINIHADPQFLKLILFNLIDNALKYSPKSSNVTIEASEINDWHKKTIFISVTNFLEEHLRPNPEMLFTRYYRHETANAVSGSGLGLSLVKAIADIIGAQIKYQDNRNSATFTVVLPNE